MTQRPAPRSNPLIALCSAISLPDAPGAPDWVHIMPMPGPVRTINGTGPFRVADAQAVIAASLSDPRGIPVDENHSTQIRGARGEPAPARGWVKDLEARPDGIWGRVEWNAKGEALMSERAYRGLSPVIQHLPDGTVLQIRSVALTNTPNLIGLTALNTETPMNWAKIAAALGLADDAGEDAILAAIAKLKGGTTEALQSSLATIATSLGVTSQDPVAIEAAARLAGTLQTTVTSLQSEVTALRAEGKAAAAKAFVEGEIAKGRLIPAPLIEALETMHSSSVAEAEKWVTAFPIGTAPRAAAQTTPVQTGVLTSLNSERIAVADQLGLPHDTYLAALNADLAKQKDK